MYMDLKEILKYKDLDLKIKELNNNNILVIGLYSYIDKKYQSIYSYLKDIEELNLNINYLDSLLKIYKDNKEYKIRNEIVNMNMALIDYVINDLNLNSYGHKKELISAGALGLIKAVEKYDISKNTKFSTYAYYYIRGYILRELIKAYDLPNSFALDFYKEKRNLKDELNNYNSNIDFYLEVMKKTNEKLNTNEMWSKAREKRLNINFPSNIEEVDNSFYEEHNMDINIDRQIFNNKLKEFLSSIPIKKEILVRLYYNINNNNYKIKDILEILNISKKTLYYHIYSLSKYNESIKALELKNLYYDELFLEDKELKKF